MSTTKMVVRALFTLLALIALSVGGRAQVTPEQQSALRANCRSDFMAKCSGVTPGGRDALLCLQKNVESLSPGCKTAVSATMPAPAEAKPAQAAPAPPPAPAAAAATVAPPAPATPAPPPPPAVTAAPVPAPQPEKTVAAPKKPAAAVVPKPAAAAPAVAAPAAISPAAEPAIPMEKIASLSLPTRAHIARRCRADEEAVCPSVKRGRGRLVACLAEHKTALSPPCREALETALK